VLASFGLMAQAVAEQAALFDVSKCSCIGELCTCPDAKGVFFTKAQIDALRLSRSLANRSKYRIR
jgi:hypothetical protein